MYYIILGKNYMKLHIPLRTFCEKNAYLFNYHVT